MTRYALAAVLAAHGVIHLIGFVVSWELAEVDGFPDRTARPRSHSLEVAS